MTTRKDKLIELQDKRDSLEQLYHQHMDYYEASGNNPDKILFKSCAEYWLKKANKVHNEIFESF